MAPAAAPSQPRFKNAFSAFFAFLAARFSSNVFNGFFLALFF
jgi:hypothetical protein